MSNREMTLDSMRVYAETAAVQLDGRHGDPSRHANWCRERDLARFVVTLIDRIRAVTAPVEVPK